MNIAHGGGAEGMKPGLPASEYEKHLDAVAAVLSRERPDVAAIQEADAPSMWSGSFDHVSRLAKAAGLAEVHHGIHFALGLGKYRVAYGTALLARRPLAGKRSYRSNVPQVHSKGFVTAEIELDGRAMLVASIHLDSDSADVRRREIEQIVSVVGAAHRPVILMGDLNSRWDRENDAVRLLVDRLDLRAYRPELPGQATFSTAQPRVRIDWVLLSKELEFLEHRVLPDKVSDHFGVLARVRWQR